MLLGLLRFLKMMMMMMMKQLPVAALGRARRDVALFVRALSLTVYWRERRLLGEGKRIVGGENVTGFERGQFLVLRSPYGFLVGRNWSMFSFLVHFFSLLFLCSLSS